jgi:hypothetical protein
MKGAVIATYPAIQHHQGLQSKDVQVVPWNQYSAMRQEVRYVMTHLTELSVLIITRWGLLELVRRGCMHRAVRKSQVIGENANPHQRSRVG